MTKTSTALEQRVKNYVAERRCRAGGYCFYRLEEPNGSDTYHALATLRLLDRIDPDEASAAFLLERQRPNGAYESIFQAGYCLKSLSILRLEPNADPSSYILRHLRAYDVDRLPAEVTSIFTKMLAVMELQNMRGLPVSARQKESVRGFLFRYRQKDGGFGYPYSTLVETFQAVRILDWLDYPVAALGVNRFLAACENPVFGFVDIPGTTSAYLEHIHAGLRLSEIIGLDVRYAGGCTEFIKACQNRNGGFSRTTHAGIATLEYTHLSIDSLTMMASR